jgi:hypothetical protein
MKNSLSRVKFPPLEKKAPLLLVELCPLKISDGLNSLNPRLLDFHVPRVAVVLKQILVNRGWLHGGIND